MIGDCAGSGFFSSPSPSSQALSAGELSLLPRHLHLHFHLHRHLHGHLIVPAACDTLPRSLRRITISYPVRKYLAAA